MKARIAPLVVVAILGGLLACSSGIKNQPDVRLTPILMSISADATMQVYEGLPHPMSSADVYVSEKLRGVSFEYEGEDFYHSPRNLEECERVLLKEVLLSPKSFVQAEALNRCGFHADFLVKMNDSGKSVTFMLCFGCGENVIYSPGRNPIHSSLAPEASKALRAVLERYYIERPDKQSDYRKS